MAVNVLCLPMLAAHELSHYVPARLLGMRPTWGWRSISRDESTLRNNLIVELCPTVVGLIGTVGGLAFLFHRAGNSIQANIAWLVLLWGIGVLVGSPYDWWRAWREIAGRESS